MRRHLSRVPLNLLLVGCAAFFLFPILAMARFGLQNVPNFLLGRDTLFSKWSLSGVTDALSDSRFQSALWLSFKLALGTVVVTLLLLIPTAVWVHLRLPKARAAIEFMTLLPYVVPAIALVAGVVVIKPHVRWFLNSDYALVPFYVVLALPFTYRSLDAGLRAIDLKTLVDASRSLGAGWGATLIRAIVPTLRTSIISSSFLIMAVVLGEYTMADVLLIEGFPRFLATYGGSNPQAKYSLSFLALIVTTVLFAVLGVLTRPKALRSQKAIRNGRTAPNPVVSGAEA
jgi:putative spermidine/putrescine transport system permease protein